MAETEETGEKQIIDQLHPPVVSRFGPGNQASKGVRHGKGVSIITEVKRLLRQIDPKTGKPYREVAARSLLAQMLKGNPAAIKEIMGRIDGPIPTEISGPRGGPIETRDAGPKLSGYTDEELASMRAINETAEARRNKG